MRKVLILLIVIIQGCSILQHSSLPLNGSRYVSKLGPMIGNSTITFYDSSFVYTERGGMFEGTGEWRLSPNGKYVIIDCVIKAKNTDLSLEQDRNLKLKIKGKDKLISDEEVFIREK